VARVVVTGATGFVGGRIAHRLRVRGDEVVAIVRTPSPALQAAGIRQIEGGFDALDATVLDGVDAIVHAAAGVGPALADARTVNRDGTRQVVTAALAGGTRRLVHISTTSVYDLEAIGDGEITEDSPLATEGGSGSSSSSTGSAYAITKAEAEGEVAKGAAEGLSTVVLRPPAVLGAGPTSTWGTRVPTMLRDGELADRHPDQTFGWVHIDDLVDAALAGIDREVEVTANVVGGHLTVRTYLEEIARIVGAARVPLDSDERAWRGRYATDRLPATLGVAPSRTFEDAMAEIAEDWTHHDRHP
jgi:2-alkyl-3-oxoalkanoate reductase